MDGFESAILLYMHGHEGRGNGWDCKSQAYEKADRWPKIDHDELIRSIQGCESDKRTYVAAADILYGKFHIRHVILHTNNMRKKEAVVFAFGGEEYVSIVSMPAHVNMHNERYLQEKVAILGHHPDLIRNSCVPCGIARVSHARISRQQPIQYATAKHDVLKEIVRGFLENHPFTNLEMVSKGPSSSGDDGIGICYDLNVQLQRFLESNGFSDVRIIGARTRFFCERPVNKIRVERGFSIPFDHVCLMVSIDGVRHWVDVGNSSPYFTPLMLPDTRNDELQIAHHSHIQYRISLMGGVGAPTQYALEHNRPAERSQWKINYTFDVRDILSPAEIESLMLSHMTDPHFGHMLRSIRISKWSLCGDSFSVKDLTGTIYKSGSGNGYQIKFCSASELELFVQKYFGEHTLRQLRQASSMLLRYICLYNDTGQERNELLVAVLRECVEAYSTAP